MMEGIKNKLVRFMLGRYGIDQLYYAGLFLALGLIMVNLFVQISIIAVIAEIIFLLMILRSFSRNISRRRIENERFLNFWNPIIKEIRFTIRRIKEIRVNRYQKCPHCQKRLKLPIKRGKHPVNCPNCGETFKVHVIL